MSELRLDVDRLMTASRVVVCCGSGGVGKTTTAAALGLRAATQGRSSLVMTIDPARRLAQAMGLEALGDEPQPIDLGAIESSGQLSAMMLDPKRTFDSLIEKYAATPQVRDTIFSNAYYRHLSSSLAGSREFMAMEKVYEIAAEGRYELLVVDTPPAQHALDFLEAPRRIFDLFEGSFVSMMLQPYRVAGRLGFDMFRRSSDRFLKLFEKLTGYEVLADLSDFFLAFSSMFEGFKERSRRVEEILRGPGTQFLLICVPEPKSLSEVDLFFARLSNERLPIGGLIVNRVHQPPPALPGEGSDLTVSGRVHDDRVGGASLDARLRQSYEEANTLAESDAVAVRETLTASERTPVVTVPHFDRDLHSLTDLRAFGESLAGQAR